MKPEYQKLKPLLSECRYQFARSGGKGGQNVNKLNTKAELYFNVAKSFLLDDDQKNLLHRRLQNKLNKEATAGGWHWSSLLIGTLVHMKWCS